MGLVFALVLLGMSFAQRGMVEDAAVSSQLRANDELLLRAVHSGDRAVWDRLTTRQTSFTWRKGRSLRGPSC